MTTTGELEQDWPAISRLLDEALALPPAQRGAWLEGLVEIGPALRRVVGEILSRQGGIESADFLGSLPTLHDGGGPAHPGDLVGPWRLLEQIGQGGMSTVWRARREDASPRREVALKLPHAAWGGGFAERLARERDILAALEHPHIARLYEAGLDAAGRPFLAMELVDGLPIDHWCDEHAAGVRERLALMLQVCAAVAHANARLVIHRDLKPANILVSATGEAKLLDFGVAKLLEDGRGADSALTELSGRALTPDFASPEQIRGEPLGTASDVYSLGVTLFVLLAGRRPYRLAHGSAAELEAALADARLPRASDLAAGPTRQHALRGDLDAIIAKALQRRPEDRYAGADALAQDIRRHLDGLPVAARPHGRAYVARRFVARHRAMVGAASLTLAALCIGLGTATWQAAQARQSARAAQRALAREAAVQEMLVEILAVAVTADPAKLREPWGFSVLLEAKFNELEQRFKGRPDEWLDLLQVISTQLPRYGDDVCSLEVGMRYLTLLRATQADPQRIGQAALNNARALARLGHAAKAVPMLDDALARLPPGAAALRGELAAERAKAVRPANPANPASPASPAGSAPSR